jgi:hypothetical protein
MRHKLIAMKKDDEMSDLTEFEKIRDLMVDHFFIDNCYPEECYKPHVEQFCEIISTNPTKVRRTDIEAKEYVKGLVKRVMELVVKSLASLIKDYIQKNSIIVSDPDSISKQLAKLFIGNNKPLFRVYVSKPIMDQFYETNSQYKRIT